MGVARSYNSTSALRPDLAFIRLCGTFGLHGLEPGGTLLLVGQRTRKVHSCLR